MRVVDFHSLYNCHLNITPQSALTVDLCRYWSKIKIQLCDNVTLWFANKVGEVAGKNIAEEDTFVFEFYCYYCAKDTTVSSPLKLSWHQMYFYLGVMWVTLANRIPQLANQADPFGQDVTVKKMGFTPSFDFHDKYHTFWTLQSCSCRDSVNGSVRATEEQEKHYFNILKHQENSAMLNNVWSNWNTWIQWTTKEQSEGKGLVKMK